MGCSPPGWRSSLFRHSECRTQRCSQAAPNSQRFRRKEHRLRASAIVWQSAETPSWFTGPKTKEPRTTRRLLWARACAFERQRNDRGIDQEQCAFRCSKLWVERPGPVGPEVRRGWTRCCSRELRVPECAGESRVAQCMRSVWFHMLAGH
eukprot:3612653-Rhodomonas_salina.7